MDSTVTKVKHSKQVNHGITSEPWQHTSKCRPLPL